MEDVVGGMVDLGAGPLLHHLVHQLAPAGDVGDPLEAADLDRGRALEARRRHPVGERPHVLGRQAVGAQQRHFLQLLAVGEVDDRAVGAALQHPVLQAEVGEFCDLGQEVGLEEDAVEGDAEPGQGLALARDHPGARLRPELDRVLVAVEDPLQQLVGAVVVDVELTGQRAGRVRRRGRSARGRT